VNDESRLAFHAAVSLSRAARDLMQNADFLDHPSDSYSILGNVLDTMRSLESSLAQLAEWHRSAEAGRHFDGDHDDSTIGIMTTVEEAGSCRPAGRGAAGDDQQGLRRQRRRPVV
jgi:hypothetical protein